jgi:hypothetical protein
MTGKQEIRVKSMELALKFMELVYDLPIAQEEALKNDEVGEFDRILNLAKWHSERFEKFIQGTS